MITKHISKCGPHTHTHYIIQCMYIVIWYISTHFCNSRIWHGGPCGSNKRPLLKFSTESSMLNWPDWQLKIRLREKWLSVTFEWWTGTSDLPSLRPGFPFPRSLCWRFGWTSQGAALTRTCAALIGQPSCRRRRRGWPRRSWRSASASAFRMSANNKCVDVHHRERGRLFNIQWDDFSAYKYQLVLKEHTVHPFNIALLFLETAVRMLDIQSIHNFGQDWYINNYLITYVHVRTYT